MSSTIPLPTFCPKRGVGGSCYPPTIEGMHAALPFLTGGLNALRLPAFFEHLGHSNVILPAGSRVFRHKDGPKQGVTSCRQAEEAWKWWKTGKYGGESLHNSIIEYAKTHDEIKGAFLTFREDADFPYPGWKLQLGFVQ